MSILWALCYYQEGIHLAIYEPEKKKKNENRKSKRSHNAHFSSGLKHDTGRAGSLPPMLSFSLLPSFFYLWNLSPLIKEIKEKEKKK